MNGCLVHRGPDDSGVIGAHRSAIGMQRLSIIDVVSGQQPIVSNDGVLAIVFNGEIYNHKEIRQRLVSKGYSFNTSSDTEVILVAYQEWGVDALDILRGMFCFAILNLKNGDIFLARDRLGVKPLYICQQDGGIVFASELKSVIQHPAVSRDIDYGSVDIFLDFRTVHGPGSMFKDVKKFPAAHYGFWRNGSFEVKRYWSLSTAQTFQGTEIDARAQFNQLFDEAVRLRMLSERPVGAYLSGGLDSTAIVASIVTQFKTTLKTFSIGFDWEGDELGTARSVSKRLGTDHHELIVSPSDFENLPKLIWSLDEPIGDPIILPMYMLSNMASGSVTVVQSGEGADELLGGYLMHKVLLWLKQYKNLVPEWAHKHLALPALQTIPLNILERLFDYPGGLGENGRHRVIQLLRSSRNTTPEMQFRQMVMLFDVGKRRSLYSKHMCHNLPGMQSIGAKPECTFDNFNDDMSILYNDWLPYLSMQILDRITMSHSLEGRVPFTDHKLVEFCFSLPPSFKTTTSRNKKLLRNYLCEKGLSDFSKQKEAFLHPIRTLFQSDSSERNDERLTF